MVPTILRSMITSRLILASARSMSTTPIGHIVGSIHSARSGVANRYTPGLFLRASTVRYISEEAKAKASTRNSAVDKSSDTEIRVYKVIQNKLSQDSAKVTLDTRFADDLKLDSLDLAELLMAIEAEFDITITDEEAEKLTTVRMAVDYIKSHK